MPIAADDSVITQAGVPVTIDVLSNDTAENGTLFITNLPSLPANGNLTLNPDQTIVYTPTTGFVGQDSFQYSVADSGDLAVQTNANPAPTSTATVTIDVQTASAGPSLEDDTVNVTAGQSVSFAPLANDTDPGGGPLNLVGLSLPQRGVIGVNADQTMTYTPNPGFVGTDSFTYSVIASNNQVLSSNVTLIVSNGDSPPDARADQVTTDIDTPVTISVLANDTDPENGALTIVGIGSAGNGNLTFNADFSITYTPDLGFTGSDSFSYTVADPAGNQDTATVNVTVNSTAQPANARNDVASTAVNTPVNIDLLANDVGAGALNLTTLSNPSRGNLVINGDQSITYTPDAGFSGVDSFAYSMVDSVGDRDTATATVLIGTNSTVPVARNNSLVTFVNTPASVDVLANDGDSDGDTLTVSMVSSPRRGEAVIQQDQTILYTPLDRYIGEDSFAYTVVDDDGNSDSAVVNVTVGTLDRISLFDINQTFNGSSDFELAPHVPEHQLDQGTLTIAFTPSRIDGLQAVLSKDAFGFGSGGHIGLFIDNGTFRARMQNTSTSFNLESAAAAIQVGQLTHVAVSFGPEGFKLYINGAFVVANPHTGGLDGNTEPFVFGAGQSLSTIGQANNIGDFYQGSIDQVMLFERQLTDGEIAILRNIALPPPADPVAPVAIDDSISTAQDTLVTFTPTNNDTDLNNDPLQISNVQNPSDQGGNVVLNANGSVSYTPANGFTGSDSFLYTITDNISGSSSARVTVEVVETVVDGPNPPPLISVGVASATVNSLAEAVTALASNDIVALRNGTYSNTTIDIPSSVSGASGARKALIPESNGSVEFTGASGINVEADHFTLAGFNWNNVGGAVVRNNGQLINVFADHVQILYHTLQSCGDPGNGVWRHLISVDYGAHFCTVQQNTVIDAKSIAIGQVIPWFLTPDNSGTGGAPHSNFPYGNRFGYNLCRDSNLLQFGNQGLAIQIGQGANFGQYGGGEGFDVDNVVTDTTVIGNEVTNFHGIENIAMKTRGSRVLFNKVINCNGAFMICRQGSEIEADGNIIVGTQGATFAGAGHRVVNNFIHNTLDLPFAFQSMVFSNGDETSDRLLRYDVTKNSFIGYNTVREDNDGGGELYTFRSWPNNVFETPNNNVVRNNIWQRRGFFFAGGFPFTDPNFHIPNNDFDFDIYHELGGGNVGAPGANSRLVDPLIDLSAGDSVPRLAANSPARFGGQPQTGTGVFRAVETDITGNVANQSGVGCWRQ